MLANEISSEYGPQNVLACYERAGAYVRSRGHAWYASARRTAIEISSGRELAIAVGVIAAYSARTAWMRNVEHARNVLKSGIAHGGEGSGAMRFSAALSARILAGEHYATVLRGKKMLAFARLIESGGEDRHAVVIDRHAVSIVLGTKLSSYAIDFGDMHVVWSSSRAGVRAYEAFADAYRGAARELNVAPSVVQAVTWIQHRAEHGIIDTPSNGASGVGYLLRKGVASVLDMQQRHLFERLNG